jgi:hypothetical protein
VSNQLANLTQDVVRASREYLAYSLGSGSLVSNGHVIAGALLTNGYVRATWSVDPGNAGSGISETSVDSNTWATATATGAQVYWRLRTIGYFSAGVATNVAVYSWRAPELCGRTNNFAGQEIEVDTPTASGQAASKGYVDNVASNITPAQWAQYPAAADVRVAGKRLTWETYSLLSNGTLAAVSYTVASSQNWFRVQHSGWDLLRISASNNLLAVTNFTIDASNYLNMAVWTQDLVNAPWPEYTTNLVDGYWTRVTAWTSVTNGDDSVNLRFTNDWTGAAFFRALCLATNETVMELLTDKTTARKLEVESATLGGVNRTNWPASGGTSGAEVTNIVGDVLSTSTVPLAVFAENAGAGTDAVARAFATNAAGYVSSGYYWATNISNYSTQTVIVGNWEVQELTLTNAGCTITVDHAQFPADGMSLCALKFNPGTNNYYWSSQFSTNSATNTIPGTAGLAVQANYTNVILILHCPSWPTKGVRQ